MKILASLAALLLALVPSGGAIARIVAFESFECDDPSAKSYAVGIQDDVTHESYTMYVKCDGSVCIYPLYGPFQGVIVSTRGWLAPADQRSRLDVAQSITAPGAPVGELWIDDGGDGKGIMFRNPNGAVERAHYAELWEHEQQGSGGGMLASVGAGGLDVSALMMELWRDRQPTMTTDERMISELVGRYVDSDLRGGEGEFFRVVDRIVQAKTNVEVLATPTAANGFTLMIGVVHPSLSGPVTVYNASGVAVWNGEASAPSAVRLAESGTYFVRGMGRDVPVSVVR